jgi:hypothetical protein
VAIYEAEEFNERFDRGEDVTSALDLAGARRPGAEQRRVNVDFPVWMIGSLDPWIARRSVWVSLDSRSSKCGSPSASNGETHPPRDCFHITEFFH